METQDGYPQSGVSPGSMASKVLTVVGARPQFVKAAVVSRAIASTPLEEILLHTGQHYDANMSDVFFAEMEIPRPGISLEIGSGQHGWQTGKMLEGIEQAILSVQPSVVLVYGDTNSTLAGALAAAKLHVPVAHVEAGLRSFNRKMPEEINRVATDHVSDLLFAPTETAVGNLAAEGISGDSVLRSGDVMLDATRWYEPRAREQTIRKDLGLEAQGYVLATVHRAESTDDPDRLKAIFGGLTASPIPVVLPLHPRTRAKVAPELLAGLTVLDPLGYFDMLALEMEARLIVTDSGGVQKEAFFQGMPCLTLRSETEWVELVELRWNRLADLTSAETVAKSLRSALEAGPGLPGTPYGTGDAGRQIVQALADRYA